MIFQKQKSLALVILLLHLLPKTFSLTQAACAVWVAAPPVN